MSEKQEQPPTTTAKDHEVEDLRLKDLTREQIEKIKGGLRPVPEGHN